MPSIYTGNNAQGGTYGQKTSFNLEVGKQWNIFSLGVDLGKTTLSTSEIVNSTNSDGTITKSITTNPQGKWYTEVRPNLNVFQQGKFTNTLTCGVGYVFNSDENIMVEYSSGIQFTPDKTWSYNLYFGSYYYTGLNSSSSNNFLGISIMYYFKPSLKNGFFNK